MGEYFVDGIRRALAVYFETEPKIRNLRAPEEIKGVLSSKEYRAYIHALHLLNNSKMSGDDIIEILSNGDNSHTRYKSLTKILSSHTVIRMSVESLGLDKKWQNNKDYLNSNITIFINFLKNNYIMINSTMKVRLTVKKMKGGLSGPKYKEVSFGEGNLGALAVSYHG